jgi:hypothetical protein
VQLLYNAGKQALARTCNLDYSEGLPTNRVGRKAFFLAQLEVYGRQKFGLLRLHLDLRKGATPIGCHPSTVPLSSRA